MSQSGYALVAGAAVGASDQAVPALLMFLAAYAVANVAAFGVVTTLRGRTALADYAGLAHQHPGLAIALVISLLSLVGIPPLAGFAGKFAVFTAAVDADLTWLAVVAVVNTVVSLSYYLRVISVMVLGDDAGPIHLLSGWSRPTTVIATAAVVVVGLVVNAVLSASRGALLPM